MVGRKGLFVRKNSSKHSTSKSSPPKRACSFLHMIICFVILGGMLLFWTSIHMIKSHKDELTMLNRVEQESLQQQQQQQQSSLRQEPISEATPITNVPTPVIVVGFPKSGTTSIFQFFHCAGVRTQHFCCCGDTSDHPPCQQQSMAECILNNTAHRRPMLENCGDYEVYAQIDGERPVKHIRGRKRYKGVLLDDGTLERHNIRQTRERNLLFRHFLPQHFSLHQLHRDYPNATYILTLREPHQWANSVMNWYQMRGRVVNEYRYFNKTMEKPGKTGARQWLERTYQEHSNYVRQFVQDHPSHTLVQVNISDPEAGVHLAEVFGLDAACWGHHNKIGNRGNNRKKQPENMTTRR